MSSSVGTVTVDLDMATAKLEAAAAKAQSTLASALGQMQSVAVAKGVVIGEAITEGIEKAFDTLKEVVTGGIEAIAGIEEASQKLGVSTETLSALRREASLSGASFDELQVGITHMATAASTGSTVFGKMGIDVKNSNGTLKSTQDILDAVATKFDSYSDSSAKTALAVKLFGRAGEDLIPMLNQLGAQGLADVIDKTQQAGVLMGGDATEAAKEYTDNLHTLHTAADDFGVILAQQLTPALNETANLVKDPEFHKALEGIATAIGGIASAAVSAAGGLTTMYNKAESALGWALDGTVTDQGSAKLAQDQLAAMQQEMALRQDPANSGDWGRAGGSPGALSKTLNSQDSLSSLFMSDDDLKKYIDRDQQNLQAYYRSLMTPNGQPPSPDAGNVASAKVNAPVIGSPGDEAAAKAAKKAQENLLQLTNTLNGKDAGPDAQAWSEYAKALNQINDDAAKMVAGGMNQNDVLVEQANATDAATQAWKRFQELRQNAVTDFTDALAKQNDAQAMDMQFQVDSVSMGDKELAQEKALYQIRQQGADQQLTLDKQLRDKKIDQQSYDEETAALKAATDQQVAIQVEGYKQMDAAQADWSKGLNKGYLNWIDTAKDGASQVASAFSSAMDGMVDALANFAITGKLDFSTLAQSILSDMIKIELKVLASQVLQNLFGSGSGTATGLGDALNGGADYTGTGSLSTSWAGIGGGITANAHGGAYDSPSLSAFSNSIVRAPTRFAFANGAGLMGEAGPEAIMPLTRGSDGNLGVRSIGNGGTAVEVNITNNGQPVQAQVTGTQQANGKTIVNMVVSAITDDLNRNGKVYQTMKQKFGITQRGIPVAGG